MRSRVACIAVVSALIVSCLSAQGTIATTESRTNKRLDVDMTAAGKPFNPGVRGQALSDVTIDRSAYKIEFADTLAVVNGSALRGVAGGLYADLYDWKNRNKQARPTTLEFMRYARDHRANLFVTANTRGLVVPDPANPGKTLYYTTETAALAPLAADWVRYTNVIVQTYRQGDTVTNPRDSQILNSLVWSSAYPGDTFSTLLARGERPVPKVIYWEIGNEPNVSVSKSIGVSNGMTLSPKEYHDRYKAITAAMLIEDPEIKVGPCIVNGTVNRQHLNWLLSDPSCHIDFISYHPYYKLGAETTDEGITRKLSGVYADQYNRWSTIRDLITSNGRTLSSIEMVASETNVSNWPTNDTEKEGQMAHALGSVETIFSFARLGLTAAHYWIWPSHAGSGTRYPSYKAFEKLQDSMGDTLLATYAQQNSLRVYVTRDSATSRVAVWALNFSNKVPQSITLGLKGLGPVARATASTLKDINHSTTTLYSANLTAGQPGGPCMDVDWRGSDISGADFDNYKLTVPAATLSLTTIEPTAAMGANSKVPVRFR